MWQKMIKLQGERDESIVTVENVLFPSQSLTDPAVGKSVKIQATRIPLLINQYN